MGHCSMNRNTPRSICLTKARLRSRLWSASLPLDRTLLFAFLGHICSPNIPIHIRICIFFYSIIPGNRHTHWRWPCFAMRRCWLVFWNDFFFILHFGTRPVFLSHIREPLDYFFLLLLFHRHHTFYNWKTRGSGIFYTFPFSFFFPPAAFIGQPSLYLQFNHTVYLYITFSLVYDVFNPFCPVYLSDSLNVDWFTPPFARRPRLVVLNVHN